MKTSKAIFQVITIWLSSACISTNFQKHSFPSTFEDEDQNNAFTLKFPTSFSDLVTEKNYLKTGTTIVGICCGDGVVLGADTRCTGGPLIVDKNKLKIHPIASRIFCCAAGTSAQCDQVTRQAAQYLALLRAEKEIAGDTNYYDDAITAALISIKSSLRSPESNRRKLQSVFILGGVDALGPSLYQIDAAGAFNQVGFASLGSGSMDALAVLESERFEWLGRDRVPSLSINHTSAPLQSNLNSDSPSPYLFSRSISVSDAVPIVRRAVRAGILNDLGSGSHVDLCVISSDGGVRRWREQLVSSWEADKAHQRIKDRERTQGESMDRPGPDSGDGSVGTFTSRGVSGSAADVAAAQMSLSRELSSTCPDDTSNIQISNNDVSQSDTQSSSSTVTDGGQEQTAPSSAAMHGVLGKRVFSRKRLVRCLQGGEIKEVWMHNTIENDLSMEVEVL